MSGSIEVLLWQCLKAVGYYLALVGLVRIAGKRLAGQMTSFDLIILIGLGVVLQSIALQPGPANAAIFVAAVLLTHRLVTLLCNRFQWIRHLMRGTPRVLVRDGAIVAAALKEERVTQEELLCGLRKMGYEDATAVKLAVLEETGQISAIGSR